MKRPGGGRMSFSRKSSRGGSGNTKRGMKLISGITKKVRKKGLELGKKAAVAVGKRAGKAALKYGNTAANTAIRGGGAALSTVAGNPAPMLGAEVVIKGKDMLAKEAGRALTNKMKKKSGGSGRKGSLPAGSREGKARTSYPAPPKSKFTPRSRSKIGVSKFSHAYDALNPIKRGTSPSTSKAANRNVDFFSSATRPTGSKI